MKLVVDDWTLGSGSIRETILRGKRMTRMGSCHGRVGSKAVLDPGFASICISVREGALVSHSTVFCGWKTRTLEVKRR